MSSTRKIGKSPLYTMGKLREHLPNAEPLNLSSLRYALPTVRNQNVAAPAAAPFFPSSRPMVTENPAFSLGTGFGKSQKGKHLRKQVYSSALPMVTENLFKRHVPGRPPKHPGLSRPMISENEFRGTRPMVMERMNYRIHTPTIMPPHKRDRNSNGISRSRGIAESNRGHIKRMRKNQSSEGRSRGRAMEEEEFRPEQAGGKKKKNKKMIK